MNTHVTFLESVNRKGKQYITMRIDTTWTECTKCKKKDTEFLCNLADFNPVCQDCGGKGVRKGHIEEKIFEKKDIVIAYKPYLEDLVKII